MIIENLEPGMVLSKDVYEKNYRLPLARSGMKLTPHLIKKFYHVGISVVNVEQPAEVAGQIITETSEVLKEIFQQYGYNTVEDFNKLIPYAEKIVETVLKFGTKVIDELFLLWKMDQYTFHHSIGTAFYSVLIGRELNYTAEQLKELALGSLLHDLGKSLIPMSILNKPGSLSPSEFDEIKKHSYLGYKILQENSEFSEDIVIIPLQHHERIDGTGYPLMLKDKKIHQYAKIVSVGDMFSALTTNRVYRDKVSKFVAGEYLTNAADCALDRYLVNVFLYAILRDIKNSKVVLNNGEVGTIVDVNYKFPTRPKLVVSRGRYCEVLDLAEKTSLYIKDIYDER